MRLRMKGQGALWCVAVGAAVLSVTSSAGAVDASAPFGNRIEHALQSAQSAFETDLSTALLIEQSTNLRFDPAPHASIEPFSAYPVNALFSPHQPRMEHRVLLSGAAARSSSVATAGGIGSGASAWMMASANAIYSPSIARRHRADRDAIVRNSSLFDNEYYAAAVAASSMPRRAKDLFVGPLQRRFDDQLKDLLPSKHSEMFAMYPSPGGAALGLLVGSCVLARRRR